MQKKLFHSRVTFHKHTFRYIHHLLKHVRVLHLLGVVGRNEVVQHDEQEEADAHQVGEHGKLNVGNHGGFRNKLTIHKNSGFFAKLLSAQGNC